jgi:hypothetical protein
MGAAHSTRRKPLSSREPSNHANTRYSSRNTTSRRPIANAAKAHQAFQSRTARGNKMRATRGSPPPKSAKRTVKTATTRRPPKTGA